MIAENKAEFFEQLNAELNKLGIEDSSELMYDLEEHFAEGERRGISESEICRELGNIAAIARSCLDLKSTAINSMVARDVAHKKAISLTKPGRSVPADPSLAASNEASIRSQSTASEDAVRSFTPIHIYQEEIPTPSQPSARSSSGSTPNTNPMPSYDPRHIIPEEVPIASQGSSSSGAQKSTANSSQSGSASSNTNDSANGTFEKIGRTVDDVCGKVGVVLEDAFNKAGQAIGKAGQAAESAVEKAGAKASRTISGNSKRRPRNNTSAKSTKSNTFTFIDVSNLSPNPNFAELGIEILLDLFLWSWLIPVFFSIIAASYAAVIAALGAGIASIIGWDPFDSINIIARLLFAAGFFVLSSVMVKIAGAITRAGLNLIKNVVNRHIKAIYDI